MPKKAAKPARAAAAAEALEESEDTPRSRPFWSGTISFGLVTIPVDFYSATRATRSSLRMLAPSGTPVARRCFDQHGKPLEASDLERGYELDDGTFVPVSDEELEALAPEQSRDIDLTRFVARAAIPPIAIERNYVLAPAGSSNLAYRLLASTLEHRRNAGIASFVMRGKQYAVAIYGQGGLLRAATLRLSEELRDAEAIGLPPVKPAAAAKVQALRRAIHKASTTRAPVKELSDQYWQRLEALVEDKKKQGVDVVRPEPAESDEAGGAEVIDLVAILRKSLGQGSDGHASSPAAPRSKPAVRRAAGQAGARSHAAKTRHPAKAARGGAKAKRAPARATARRSAHGR